MLLLDYNAICIASVMVQKDLEFDKQTLKHYILNSVRMHTMKHKNKYGYPVICCDSRSWRKDYYPEYKASRKKGRDGDSRDWDAIFQAIDEVRQDFMDNFPYKVIKIDDAEADDIIGTLVEHTQEFGNHEDVMIISGDKDFVQLQAYGNVKQYSPIKKSLIEEKHPKTFLLEHILRGDSGDGVPNILSDDDTFVTEGKRQKPVSKKFVEAVMEADTPQESSVWTADIERNFARNKKLIDLRETPEAIKSNIINTYVDQKVAHKSKVMNYLVKNRMKLLIECLSDFV